jgi:hypothetical protein
MRYTRLRRQIEGGTLISKHGNPFSGVTEKTAADTRKRKTGSHQETEKGAQPGVLLKTITPDRKIKSEPDDFSDRYETDYSEGSDSEDEMPLAKRRHGEVKPIGMASDGSSAAQGHQGVSSKLHDGHHEPCSQPISLYGRRGQQDITQGQSEIPRQHLNMPKSKDSTSYPYEPLIKHTLEVADQPPKFETPYYP